jgi:hypothetical protein
MLLFRFDDYLMDRAQRFSDWTTDLFDRNCFWLSALCLHVMAIIAILVVAIDAIEHRDTLVEDALSSGFLCLCILFCLKKLHDLDDRYNGVRATMNDFRPRLVMSRLISFGNVMGALTGTGMRIATKGFGEHPEIDLFTVATFVLTITALYFGCCTPKPRAPQTEQKLAMSEIGG